MELTNVIDKIIRLALPEKIFHYLLVVKHYFVPLHFLQLIINFFIANRKIKNAGGQNSSIALAEAAHIELPFISLEDKALVAHFGENA